MSSIVATTDITDILNDELKALLSNDSTTTSDATLIQNLIDLEENFVVGYLSGVYSSTSILSVKPAILKVIIIEFVRYRLYKRKKNMVNDDEYQRMMQTLNDILKGKIILDGVDYSTSYTTSSNIKFDDTYFYDKTVFQKEWTDL